MRHEAFVLPQNNWVPNNQVLPVLVYRSAAGGDCETVAADFERRFAVNGWPAKWRDTIFDYHHYHSTAHEALGVAAGRATLVLGGPHGERTDVKAGDALVLPVGTGHCRLEASDDFMVVGAYPKGQDWDICRSAPDESARERIATLPIPESDPVEGAAGALIEQWRNNDR